MSSATSTEQTAGRLKPVATFRPWHFFVLAGFIAATSGVLVARQTSSGHLVLVSISILCAAFTAAALHRTLAPLTLPQALESAETLGRRTRAALEREKALVLRSIKELEFDHAMGKVSDRDFQEMAGRLRARAIDLIKRLDADAGGYRDVIERELARRMKTGSDPILTKNESVPRCAECGTTNDSDARFCKQCGAKLT